MNELRIECASRERRACGVKIHLKNRILRNKCAETEACDENVRAVHELLLAARCVVTLSRKTVAIAELSDAFLSDLILLFLVSPAWNGVKGARPERDSAPMR